MGLTLAAQEASYLGELQSQMYRDIESDDKSVPLRDSQSEKASEMNSPPLSERSTFTFFPVSTSTSLPPRVWGRFGFARSTTTSTSSSVPLLLELGWGCYDILPSLQKSHGLRSLIFTLSMPRTI